MLSAPRNPLPKVAPSALFVLESDALLAPVFVPGVAMGCAFPDVERSDRSRVLSLSAGESCELVVGGRVSCIRRER